MKFARFAYGMRYCTLYQGLGSVLFFYVFFKLNNGVELVPSSNQTNIDSIITVTSPDLDVGLTFFFELFVLSKNKNFFSSWTLYACQNPTKGGVAFFGIFCTVPPYLRCSVQNAITCFLCGPCWVWKSM